MHLSPSTLLAALGLEGGGVNVFRPSGQRFYHVFFRHRGRQVLRSCGVEDYGAAKDKAAGIFAEVVATPLKVAEQITLQEIKAEMVALRAAVAGGVAVMPTLSAKLTSDALKTFLDARKNSSPSHFKQLSGRNTRFVTWLAAEGLANLGDVTAPVVRRYLDSLEIEARSQKNVLNDLANFFRWCKAPERAWLAADPCEGMERPTTRTVKLPAVCKVDDVEALFSYLEKERPELVLFYALTFFGGVRVEETKRAFEDGVEGWEKADNYRPAEGAFYVRRPKVGAPRWVEPPRSLAAWLTLRPGRRLAAQVIEAAKKAKVEPTKATLGPLFIFSGLDREGWELRGNRVINSTKRRGKKPLPDVSVDELLWEVAVLTWPQQPVAPEKREMPTREVGS